MTRTVINAPDVFRPSPAYSHAVKAAGLVFVSGTMAHGPDGKVIGETEQEQTAQCFRNLTAILKAAGTTLDRTLSATVIMAEGASLAAVNEEWVKWFPLDPPARQGARLPVVVPGVKVSIALIVEG